MTVVLLLFISSLARADESGTAADFVARHARVLTKDEVYYRWQSTASGENLVRAGTMTEALNTHFMGQADKITAGPGLYLAADPFSSSSYLPDKGGNLIEVRIAKGTRVIDVKDPEVTRAMGEAKIGLEDIYHGQYGAKDLLVKYTDHWYVGKNLTKQASFGFFPGPAHTPENLNETLDRALGRSDAVAKQMVDQIRTHRPDAFARILADGTLSPGFWSLLPSADLVRAVDTSLRDGTSWKIQRVLKTLSHASIPIGVFKDRPEVVERAVQKFSSISFDLLEPTDISYLTDLALHAPREIGRPLISKILIDTVEDEHLRRDWSQFANRVRGVITHAELTPAERSRLTKSLVASLDHYVINQDNVTDLRRLITKVRLDDPILLTRMSHAERFSERFHIALDSEKRSDVHLAMNDHSNVENFVQAFNRFESALSNNALYDGVEDLLAHEPQQFTRLLRTARDFEAAVSFSDEVRAAVPHIYQAALDAEPLARATFINHCLRWEACRGRLVPLAIMDDAALFRSLPDPRQLEQFVLSLQRSQDPRGVHLAQMIRDLDEHAAVAATTPTAAGCLHDLSAISGR